jgi:hypothetical protein
VNARTHSDVWVCTDCYFAHHYGATEVEGQWFAGDSDTPADRQPLARLDGFELADNTDSETGEGIDEFSWRSCQGCGSTLGGGRHRLAAWQSTPPATYYAVGHNVAGYLPEADVAVFDTFDEAKRCLIHDMLLAADYAETETIAEDLTNSAEDVNLWNGPDTVYVEMIDSPHCIPTAWWIMEADEAPENED